MRYKHQVYNLFAEEKQNHKIPSNLYVNLYLSAYKVFKNYPVFGVGNKNYRVETCSNEKKLNYICTTHPHQIYFEFLSEHGLLGSAILFFILFI